VAGAFDAISTVAVPEQAIVARHYNECIAKAGLSTGQLAENMREYAETQPDLQNKPAPGVLMRYHIVVWHTSSTVRETLRRSARRDVDTTTRPKRSSGANPRRCRLSAAGIPALKCQ